MPDVFHRKLNLALFGLTHSDFWFSDRSPQLGQECIDVFAWNIVSETIPDVVRSNAVSIFVLTKARYLM